MKRFLLALVVISIPAGLSGCAQFASPTAPKATALQGPPLYQSDSRCDGYASPTPPPYAFADLKDCTAPDTLIIFAFSGGGMRSASFGYGVLRAAHNVAVPDETGTHPLDADIDIVSGVSGGSFTAAAFANQREALFPAPGAPDHYRDKFLSHDFEHDLAALRMTPWRWHGLLPMFSAEEIATVYGEVEFSSSSDKLFAPTFGDLAKKGRPFLLVQATDLDNQQSFAFTQDDFDVICSDVNKYPVADAIAASSAVPLLFSPITLTNHHSDAKPGEYCATHRPKWVDESLGAPRADLSRLYTRAAMANRYLPDPATGRPASSRQMLLQDGGVVDNLALRGLQDFLAQYLEKSSTVAWKGEEREAACRAGIDRVRRVLLVAVNGERQPDNTVSGQTHSWNMGLIAEATTSTAMKANSLETMQAADDMTKKLATHLGELRCMDTRPVHGRSGTPNNGHAERVVAPYFARVSLEDLDPQTTLSSAACKKRRGKPCTPRDLARGETGLNYSRPQVDGLIAAGQSAFFCNPEIRQFLNDSHATVTANSDLACRKTPSATSQR